MIPTVMFIFLRSALTIKGLVDLDVISVYEEYPRISTGIAFNIKIAFGNMVILRN